MIILLTQHFTCPEFGNEFNRILLCMLPGFAASPVRGSAAGAPFLSGSHGVPVKCGFPALGGVSPVRGSAAGAPFPFGSHGVMDREGGKEGGRQAVAERGAHDGFILKPRQALRSTALDFRRFFHHWRMYLGAALERPLGWPLAGERFEKTMIWECLP